MSVGEIRDDRRSRMVEVAVVIVAIIAGALVGGNYRISVMCAILAIFLAASLVRERSSWTALLTAAIVVLGIAAFPWVSRSGGAADNGRLERPPTDDQANRAAIDARIGRQVRDAQHALDLPNR